MPTDAHDDQRDDDRERQAQRDHQRGSPIAEEQEQQDNDQDGCLAERADDGSDGAIDQPAAVIEHVDGDALRQPRLELVEACAHIADELAGIGTPQAKN